MYVARFQNKNGLIIKQVSKSFVETIREPNGTPVDHPYGGCLIIWQVPTEWEREAEWRAKSGWLNDHIVWEYNNVIPA